jgi:tetratricopeptide (TPR) repeat protein
MKKKDIDVRDIYRSKDPAPQQAPASEISDLIARALRRQWFFNLFVSLLALILVSVLTVAFITNYVSAPEETAPAGRKAPYIASYTLPAEEQWALEYQQIASQADSSEPSGPKAFSSKWVKNAAFHIIMGEQASRINNLVASQDHLETAVLTFPSMTGINGYLGTVYLKQQYFEKAIASLKKALEEDPSVAVLNNLGVAYLGMGEYKPAEALLQQVLQQRPDLAGCYKNLALLYQKTARTNEAVASFEKYFLLNPRDTGLITNYVSYLTVSGRIRDALDFLDRIEGADSLAVQLLLAKTAAQDNDAERAVRALRKAVQFITPRQLTTEMHNPVFDKIAQSAPFETLINQLEMASVSLSTNLNTKGPSGY